MTIPIKIKTELAFLQSQVTAAAPLANAPFATIQAIQLNAGQLVSDIQTALTGTNLLDAWVAPIDPVSMALGLDSVLVASKDQNSLSLMRGLVGRAAANLDQL